MTPQVVLSIAGSDSGGGAGIQADLRTFAAHAVHGTTAVAALTAQNTVEVRGVLATPASFLRAQVEAVLDDLPVAAVKTGMLATAENVHLVADLAAQGRLPNLVIDPVLVASTGHRLLDADAERAYRDVLLPHALVATPNCREAAVLAGVDPVAAGDLEGQVELAHAILRATGCRWVVVTGGDRGSDTALDVVSDGAVTVELTAPRLATRNNHGTGCSFAAAVAARLAVGDPPLAAIEHAKQFVHAALARAATWDLGAGRGPVDHLGFEPVPGPPTDLTATTRGTAP